MLCAELVQVKHMVKAPMHHLVVCGLSALCVLAKSLMLMYQRC